MLARVFRKDQGNIRDGPAIKNRHCRPFLSAPAPGGLTAGVRPEDTIISAAPGAGSVEVEVVLVEPAGPFNWVDVNWKGVVKKGISVTEEIFSAGDRAYMSFPADRVMYFDTASGKRI